MKRNPLLRHLPLTLLLGSIALFVLLAASSAPAQALNSDQGSALQGTAPPPTAPVSTVPAATLVAPTVVIPNTGGNDVIVNFFSNWVLWAVLGVVVIALLVALMARPAGPPPGPPPA